MICQACKYDSEKNEGDFLRSTRQQPFYVSDGKGGQFVKALYEYACPRCGTVKVDLEEV